MDCKMCDGEGISPRDRGQGCDRCEGTGIEPKNHETVRWLLEAYREAALAKFNEMIAEVEAMTKGI